MSEHDQERKLEGPEILHAFAYGDSIPMIKMAALDAARELYGPDAALRIERVGSIQNSASSKGRFCANVTIRCFDFPEDGTA